MSDTAIFILIFGTAVGIAITWFIVQTIYIRKLKVFLASEGWSIVPLNLFRIPKLPLARIADCYVLNTSGRYRLLVAQKIVGNQLELFEINAISTPAPITSAPLYNVAVTAMAGLYSMTFVTMPINNQLSRMNYKDIKVYLKENAKQIKILSFGSNLPNRWRRSYLASRDVWQLNMTTG